VLIGLRLIFKGFERGERGMVAVSRLVARSTTLTEVLPFAE
jgi:hypothetical protein